MSAKHNQPYWIGIFVALNMLASFALAAPDSTSAAEPAAQAAPADPEKLMEQAEKEINRMDLVAAIKKYHQAAELNHMPAQVEMGKFAEIAQEYEEAVGWFLMAAMQGDAAGQYQLAHMYQLGHGIEQDNAKASYWYRRSAAKNYVPALRMIAQAYTKGEFGLKIDMEQSNAWNGKADRLEAIERKIADEKMAKFLADKKKLAEEAAKKNKK